MDRECIVQFLCSWSKVGKVFRSSRQHPWPYIFEANKLQYLGMENLSVSQQIQFSKLSTTAAKKNFLCKILATSAPNEEFYAGLNKILHDLEDEDFKYSAMESRSVHVPKQFDVLITDITEADLTNIGNEPGAPRLSVAAEFKPSSYPIYGIIHGTTLRVFVPLIVCHYIPVPFLFATGSPNTYLREDTMRALGMVENIPSDTMVQINGIGITVYRSRGHFKNVDLIGQDWMSFLGASVKMDYRTQTVEVHTGV